MLFFLIELIAYFLIGIPPILKNKTECPKTYKAYWLVEVRNAVYRRNVL